MFTKAELNLIATHYNTQLIQIKRNLGELERFMLSERFDLSDDVLERFNSVIKDYKDKIEIYENITCKAYEIPF